MVKGRGRHLSWHPPLLTGTPHQREDVSDLDRFSVHRCPTRRVFSSTGLELVTRKATIRYLYHSATAAMSQVYKWMGLDEWSSWFNFQVLESNRSQDIGDLNKF
ncbi:uncharacterized protein TNCV_54361 [Trichonephila clavipes]|nr:uncharacterized protein TNCV_54361 [Trichonephila clavipes]